MKFIMFRVKDGINFKQSKQSVWGVNGILLTRIKKLIKGDILCFITSKEYGGKIVGFATFVGYHDKRTEPLVSINTYTNKELGWSETDEWPIQIQYEQLYLTEDLNLKAIIKNINAMIHYDTARLKNNIPDLEFHYRNIMFYMKPKVFV